VALILWLTWVSFTTPSFQACIAEQEAAQADQISPKHAPVVALPLGALAEIGTQCTGRFIHEQRDALTAIATIFIAWFTFTLWSATRGQLAVLQGSIELSRQEFDAEHRPWIAIRDIKLRQSVTIDKLAIAFTVDIAVENTGRTPAIDLMMFGGSAPTTEPIDVQTALDELIAKYEVRGELPSETVFPQEKTTYQAQVGQAIHRHAIIAEGEKKYLWDTVSWGAFFYKSAFDKRLRYTSFVYGVYMTPRSRALTKMVLGLSFRVRGSKSKNTPPVGRPFRAIRAATAALAITAHLR
jgi:hypothetical protein